MLYHAAPIQALEPDPTGPMVKSDLALALQLLLVAIVMPCIIAGECMETAKCYQTPTSQAPGPDQTGPMVNPA